MNTKSPERQADDYRLAVHELGHYEAAASFGIPASPKLFGEAERYASGGKIIGGTCRIDPLAKAAPFQRSVCGWAGYIAEHLCGVAVKPNKNPFPLQPDTLRDFYNAALTEFEEIFTYSDQCWIFTGNVNTWRSFKSAYKRLLPKVDKIKRLAEIMAADMDDSDRAAGTVAALRDFFRRQKSATHADFLRLVCGESAESYEQFIRRKAEQHLANGTANFADVKKSLTEYFRLNLTPETRAEHLGKLDGEIAAILFAAEWERALNLQRSIYGGNFNDETAWLAAAREFQQWANAKGLK